MAYHTKVKLVVNGDSRALDADNRTSLLDALREQLHLTGTKKDATMDNVVPVRSWSMVGGSTPA